jgi:hypothetical protein
MSSSDSTQNLKFRPNRTFICSVVFLDIVEYSKKSVEEQINLKERFNTLIGETLTDISVSDRIILDTGDGAAIGFLGDPEDALFVAMNMRDVLNTEQSTSMPDLRVRMGINLGPVKLLKDINNQVNLIGDGINVAQRIMSFADTGQLLVSRSYYDIVSCLSQEYAQLFQYQGARADKHVREHDIYAVGHTGLRSAPAHHHHETNEFSVIADGKINAAGVSQSKDSPNNKVTETSTFGKFLSNKKNIYIAVPVVAFIVAAMFVFIPAEQDKPAISKKSTKASRAADKAAESKKSWWASKSETNQQSVSETNQQLISGGSARADEIVFTNAGIRSTGSEVTLSISIRNTSSVEKSVALYDNYVSWPKSKLIDQTGKSYDVTNVIFFKDSQKITSQAAGTQGLPISPNSTVSASLIFKTTGKGIKSINIHPFIYQGRGWKEHDLPIQK